MSTEQGGASVLHQAIRNRLLAVAAIAVSTAVLGGCISEVDQRGNLPEKDRLTEIHPGTTTRDQVAKILGTPSSTSVFDNNSWYYISRKTKKLAFLDPDTIDQQVYVVNFDPNGVVKSIERKGLRDARNITPAPGATPAPGRELTFLEQVLGNIGRFNKRSSDQASTANTGNNGDTLREKEMYLP